MLKQTHKMNRATNRRKGRMDGEHLTWHTYTTYCRSSPSFFLRLLPRFLFRLLCFPLRLVLGALSLSPRLLRSQLRLSPGCLLVCFSPGFLLPSSGLFRLSPRFCFCPGLLFRSLAPLARFLLAPPSDYERVDLVSAFLEKLFNGWERHRRRVREKSFQLYVASRRRVVPAACMFFDTNEARRTGRRGERCISDN